MVNLERFSFRLSLLWEAGNGFFHQVDFILLFRPPCLENRTFWIPACAKMTDYEVNAEDSMVAVSTRHRACRRKPLRGVWWCSPVSALSFSQRPERIAMRPIGIKLSVLIPFPLITSLLEAQGKRSVTPPPQAD